MNTEDLATAVLARRYRLLHRIGEGGMGVVYEAEDTESGERRAAKILRKEFLHHRAVVERFLEEAKACQRLQHPNVVGVFDAGRAEDGTPFFIMELLHGAPLSAYVKGGLRLAVVDAANVLHGVLSGLAAAHAAGVIHRDLKPENVVVTRDAGGVRAKILDFGVAKVMDEAGGMGSKTQTGMLLGTPAYMSPEQIRSAKEVDPRSDLFAAGVLFYEMLTGRQAFAAGTEFGKLTAVLTTEPEPLERVDPALYPLSSFMSRALAKDRNVRFQRADEMLQALTGVMQSSALQAATAPAPPGTMRAAAGPSGAPPALAASGAPPPMAAGPSFTPSLTPVSAPQGGTLASVPSATVHERLAEVTIDTGARRVIPSWIAAVLVSAALFFGFLVGLAVGRSM